MLSKISLSLTRSTRLAGIFMSSTNTGKLSMPRMARSMAFDVLLNASIDWLRVGPHAEPTSALYVCIKVDLPFEKPPKYATTHAGGVGRKLSANAPSEASERTGLAHTPLRPRVSMLAARRTSSLTAKGSMRILRISPPRSDFVTHAASP